MNSRNQLCEGCFRTIAEISAWSQYSDVEKQALIDRLAQRRQHVLSLAQE